MREISKIENGSRLLKYVVLASVLGLCLIQSVAKWLKNVARACRAPIFLTKIVCNLWIRGILQHIPHHTNSRARRRHFYIERPWC